MIIVGCKEVIFCGNSEITKHKYLKEFSDLKKAKAYVNYNSERNNCEGRGIDWVYSELHDTKTKKSWSVHNIGISKLDYRNEETSEFIDRYSM